MAPERKVPVMRSDFSIVDTEFDSIRERFEQEMRRMEEEMARFREELLNREKNFFQKSLTSMTSSQKSEFKSWSDGKEEKSSRQSQNGIPGNVKTTSTSSMSEKQVQNYGDRPSFWTSWFDDFESPLVQNGTDGKQLKLRFDVSQYEPEEIVVKTIDNRLTVQAKHEEQSENRSVYREYNREFLLPKGTNPEAIKSSLSRDGVLTVEAPLPAIEGPRERLIPVKHY